MKSLSKGLTLINLFVLASILHDGENAELTYNQEHINRHIYKGQSQKMNIQKSFKRISRISEKKCAQYIRELKYSAPKVHMESGADGVLAFTEIGGRDAFIGEFSHMGALGWRTIDGDWGFHCGSSLISHKFLLTAAHCSKCQPQVNVVNDDPEIVRLGTNVIKDFGSDFDPVDFYILRIILHPKYTSPKKYYDIALMELQSRVRFKRNLHPACLWSRSDTTRHIFNVTSTGWGVVDPVRRTSSTMLQAIEVDIIESQKCNYLLHRLFNRNFNGVHGHQLCAGKLAGGVDSCQGDSGGPLQVEIPNLSRGVKMHYLIGVTSFGYGCALTNRPGVYTRVSSFINWIEKNVWRG